MNHRQSEPYKLNSSNVKKLNKSPSITYRSYIRLNLEEGLKINRADVLVYELPLEMIKNSIYIEVSKCFLTHVMKMQNQVQKRLEKIRTLVRENRYSENQEDATNITPVDGSGKFSAEALNKNGIKAENSLDFSMTNVKHDIQSIIEIIKQCSDMTDQEGCQLSFDDILYDLLSNFPANIKIIDDLKNDINILEKEFRTGIEYAQKLENAYFSTIPVGTNYLQKIDAFYKSEKGINLTKDENGNYKPFTSEDLKDRLEQIRSENKLFKSYSYPGGTEPKKKGIFRSKTFC